MPQGELKVAEDAIVELLSQEEVYAVEAVPAIVETVVVDKISFRILLPSRSEK